MPIFYTSAVQRYNGQVLNYITYTAASSLNDILKSIDTKFGLIINNPVSAVSSAITYNGQTDICDPQVQFPAGNINGVLEYIGNTLCGLNHALFNEGGDIIEVDPLAVYDIPVYSPGYVYPVLPAIPTSKPVSTYIYPPTTGIINYNPSDGRIAGHFEGVIGALDFADNYANIRPDYDYLKATLGGLFDNFAQSLAAATPAGLTVSFGAGNYYIDGQRIYVPAVGPTALVAFCDNYIDITANGAYINNFVPNGNPAPAIVTDTIRLYKLVTNAFGATSTTVLAQLYPFGTTYFQDQSVNARLIAAGAVGPAQLEDTSVIPGSYNFLSATIDQQGRVTAAESAVDFTSLANLDLMQYNAVTSKWVNIPIVGSILPTGNMGDYLRFNSFYQEWYSATMNLAEWTNAAIPYNAYTAMGGSTGYVLRGLPSGAIITGYKIKHDISFTGGTITAAVIQLIDANGTDITAGGFDVFQAPGNTVGVFNCALSGSIIPPQAGANDIKIQLTVTGDVLANLVAGEATVWYEYITLI